MRRITVRPRVCRQTSPRQRWSVTLAIRIQATFTFQPRARAVLAQSSNFGSIRQTEVGHRSEATPPQLRTRGTQAARLRETVASAFGFTTVATPTAVALILSTQMLGFDSY